jgi:formamidopyrimidine-DNA glycosylase
MIELPEAAVLAKQINTALAAKRIHKAVAGQSPHKFAWYTGNPADYADLLVGKTIDNAVGMGGMVKIRLNDIRLVFSDGVNLRFHQSPFDFPQKHQLIIEFDDSTAMSATVAMYGGLLCFARGTNENPYYLAAREKPSPLSDQFSFDYFTGLFNPECDRLSLKAFLATEQRVPGLGNGVLQDVLFQARLHPKSKVTSLGKAGKEILYQAIKTTLAKMAEEGGRDTEKDLFGNMGAYRTRMSKNTVGQPCLVCSNLIQKQSYMGGSIYFCSECQKEG